MDYWDTKTIEQIRKGFYSALYFNRTQHMLLKENNLKPITMQIFQKHDAVLGGVDQVLELLKIGSGYFDQSTWIDKSAEVEIESLSDGDAIEPFTPVMYIKGPYAYFAHLESLYLGILARTTKIATNTRRVVTAAKGKPVIFFADRFDYFLNQQLDGLAAKIGGIHGVATAAQGTWWDGEVMGTIPHALIAMHNGDTVAAAKQFAEQFPAVPLIVLADFENDCVKTALEAAKVFGPKLAAVRLDTSELMVDESLKKLKDTSLTGVNAKLVTNVREALDANGYAAVKIVVSGGFTAEKVEAFEKETVPVDMYGVGSSLLRGTIDFTADCVQVAGVASAKVGRQFIPNKKLWSKSVSK